jgi:hypothetical protein
MTPPAVNVVWAWQRRIITGLIEDDGEVYSCSVNGNVSDCQCPQGQDGESCDHVAALLAVGARTRMTQGGAPPTPPADAA